METRIRVAALVIVEGKVLLVSASSRPEWLVPPGGGVEAGETLVVAVAREVAEEADLQVQPDRLVAYREVQRPDRRELEFYFAARPLQNPVCAEGVSQEDRRVRWVPLTELAQVPHFPEQLARLCELVQQPGSGAEYLGLLEL